MFVDGGVTPYNNPAFLLTGLPPTPHNLEWPKGEQNLLLVSVGTGAAATARRDRRQCRHNMLNTGLGIPGALMDGALVDQDINCRAVGRCAYGDVIDRELLDMVPREGPDEGKMEQRLARPRVPLENDLGRSFLFARYNVDLSREGLDKLDCADVNPELAAKMDKADPAHIELLLRIGQQAARQVDVAAHFGSFAR